MLLLHEKRISLFVLDLGAISDSCAATETGGVSWMASCLSCVRKHIFFCSSVPLCKGALSWPLLGSNLQDLVLAVQWSYSLLVLVSLPFIICSSHRQTDLRKRWY